jgi:hypothetical protein
MSDLLQEELTGPPVTVTIAGKDYPLAYSMASAIFYKKATKVSLFAPGESTKIPLTEDPERWLALLWAGLHQEDAQGNWSAPLTLRELMRLKIADADLAMLDAAIWSAFRKSNPDPRKEEDPGPNAQAAPSASSDATSPKSLATSIGYMPVPAADLDSPTPNS